MKAYSIILVTAFSCLLATIAKAETTAELNSSRKQASHNICANFAPEKTVAETSDDAPPPVRTLAQMDRDRTNANVSEEIFYRQLGLVPAKDGSYVCIVRDPNNSRREFTLFKVKRIDNILVASSFLDRGNFLAKQKQAISDLFLEMIQFYTDLPPEYDSGIDSYFQEFYSRMADGRLQPSSDRVYAVDEPSSTVIMYHPATGDFQGTVISLNISLF